MCNQCNEFLKAFIGLCLHRIPNIYSGANTKAEESEEKCIIKKQNCIIPCV